LNPEARRQLARQIAETPGAVTRDGDAWAVNIRPTGEGSERAEPLSFRVRPGTPARPASCTCPDFKRSRGPRPFTCEHILAVLYAAENPN
jgi:hypothetical protein